MKRARAAGALLCLAAQILTLGPVRAEAGFPAGRPESAADRPGLPGAGGPSLPPETGWVTVAADSAKGGSTQQSEPPRPAPHPWEETGPRSPKWGIVGSAVGVVAGVGMALRIKSEADKRYDSYLTLADPVEARRRLDAAERYDRAALIGWAMAQVSFVGLVYFLTRQGDRTLTPVRGEPVVRASRDGVQVGLRVTP